MTHRPSRSTLFPYTTLFRSVDDGNHVTGRTLVIPGQQRGRHNNSLAIPGSAEGKLGCIRRSEEHTSELQSLRHLVCRLLLEKKKTNSPRQRTILCLCRYALP